MSNLQKNLDKEDYERLLQVANQCKVAVHNREGDNSFSHQNRQNYSNPSNRVEDNPRAVRQQANSTELPGHDHATTIMSKVRHRMCEILPQPHENEEELRRRHETPETPDNDKVSMTRDMFTSIMTKALEDQKNLADATSDEAVKVAFTEGVKHGSERQTQPSHSSPMECESVHPVQNPIMTSGEYGLSSVHLLRPAMGNAIGTLTENSTIPVQQGAKLPVCSTNNGVTDGNKTFQTMGSFITGKRYKRETNLKFSELCRPI